MADSDPRWRPNSFGYENVGSSVQFRFTGIKLLDFDEQFLEQLDNPFALVVQAHLRALKARGDPNLIFSEKVTLIRKLMEKGYTRESERDSAGLPARNRTRHSARQTRRDRTSNPEGTTAPIWKRRAGTATTLDASPIRRLLELHLLATEVSSLDEFVQALEAEAPSE